MVIKGAIIVNSARGDMIDDEAMIDALKSKKIQNGGTIVEGTAGNTGIGLTLIGNCLGYKSVIVMPETQTKEKKDLLEKI